MNLKINSLIHRLYTPIKYICSSGISFLMDQLLFNMFAKLCTENFFLIIAKLIARIFSSLFNFLFNSKAVFQNKNKNSIYKYYTLVGIQALISSFSIFIFKNIFDELPVSVISVLVDIIIFFVNYFAQKEWVFR